MKSTEYKRQFLAFLLTGYPEGVPKGVNKMTLYISNTKFDFRFDAEDLNSLIGKSTREKKISFKLSESDIQFLAENHISTDNVKESEKQR